MSKIKMKVLEYDLETNSIIVAFASPNAKKAIEEYEHCAYQPTMFDNPDDPASVLEEIARAGIFVTQQQDKEDDFTENKVLETKYAQYVGKEFTYDVSTLLANEPVDTDDVIYNADDDADQILADIASADDEIDLNPET